MSVMARNQNTRVMVYSICMILLCALTAALAAIWQSREINKAAKLRFVQQAERAGQEMQKRLLSPEYALKGMRGLLAANPEIGRDDFRRYAESRDFASDYPNVRGFGLIVRVERKDLNAFVARERADNAPNFKIHSSGNADDLYVIKYIEPLSNNRQAWGYDVGSEAIRRAAVEQAALTRETTLTGRIVLVQDGKQGPGYLILLAVYRHGMALDTVEKREKALIGFVYAPIVISEVMRGMGESVGEEIDLTLYDGEQLLPENQIYQSSHQDKLEHALFRSEINLNVGGRNLLLLATSNQRFEASINRSTPMMIGLAGGLLSLLIGTIIWALMSGRSRALALANEMTASLHIAKNQAEAALRESQAFLATMRIHALVSITDKKGVIIEVNDAFCRLSGYSKEELIGQQHHIINSGIHSTEFWREMWSAIGNGQPWRGLVCNRNKQGEYYWVDSIIAPMLGEDGSVEKYVSMRFDVTASKNAADELANEQLRLANILEATAAGTWEWQVPTGALRINPRWAQMLGYTEDALQSLDYEAWRAMLHPDDGALLDQQFSRHLSGDLDYIDCEFRLLHQGNYWLWVQLRGRLMSRDADGQPLLLACTQTDISVRKLAEVSQQQASVLLSAVLDAATEVSVIATRADGVISLFNKGAERLLGYSAQEMIDLQTPAILHDPEEVQERAQALSMQFGKPIAGFEAFVAIAKTGVAEEREWTYIRKDGTRFTVLLIVSAMRHEDGTIYGYLGVGHDITRVKQYEAELKEARGKAELASVAKSTFLANMSHEIRTPMNGVIGMSNLLLDTPLNEEQRKQAEIIRSSAGSLLGVINDILDFSKIEAGKLEIEIIDFDLEQQLEEFSAIMQFKAHEKGLQLTCRKAPQVPVRLRGDPGRIRQILTNLTGNAIKFTENGSVHIKVELASRNEEGVLLRFAVRDSGVGIAKDKQSALFQSFSQLDVSTTRKYGGSGLGLAISRQLAELMGGEVGVESDEGEGAEFWFTVQLGLPEQAKKVWRSQARVNQEAKKATTKLQGRVLLAEDHPINQLVAQSMLAKFGVEVVTVNNGQEAVDALAKADFDLVLMDMQMPVMDGLEATQQIRNPDSPVRQHQIPIVALTANAMLEDQQHCRDAGMNGHLAKPLAADDLAAVLNYWLADARKEVE